MTIRILTEHEKGLGLGHVARCYNLARSFVEMGYSVDFFVRGNAPFQSFIEKQGKLEKDSSKCYVLELQWENIENPALLESDICIIDSYIIDDFTPFLDSTKILVLLDDFGKHLSKLTQIIESSKANKATTTQAFLLNPNGFYKTQEIPKDIREHIFSGLQYALLNPCFHDKNFEWQNCSCEFLVCLGGEDANDISATIFNQLLSFAKSIVVIVGASYKGSMLKSQYLCKDSMQQDFKQPYRIYHNITQTQVAALLANAKNCIVSGGGIVFEALKLCKRVFVINLATNQDIQIEMLATQNLVTPIALPLQQSYFNYTENANHNKLCKEIGIHVNDFASKIALLALNQNIAIAKHKKAQNFSLNTHCAIDFCNLSQTEGMRILTYRNHPFVRERMYGSSIINAQTHHNFLQSLHSDEHSRYFLVQDLDPLQTTESTKTHDIGVINFSRINLKHRHAYLGIYKNPFLAETNKGYGHALMQMIKHIGFNHYNFYMLYLEVVATNTNAIKFYEKEGFSYLGTLQNGFRIQQNNYESFCDVLLYGIQNPNID